MKKKYIILITFILAVTAGIIGVYLLTRPTVLGNMSNEYSKQVTTTSDISFAGEAGNKIKFVFESDVISGNLDMTLYDADGTAVYTLDNAKELVTYLILERSNTYTLVAKCDNFVGTYKIFVYLDEVNTSTDSSLPVQ
ncbi:MAG: hypothetical protein K2P76_10215 [Lachnospiraceae bacterium]|nr:hypothetical protein [Lachnospiraceae bacterium]MDE6982796.1 hypothetical protein [Lachnospiraceae bacterium]